jgi:hypothetical protein
MAGVSPAICGQDARVPGLKYKICVSVWQGNWQCGNILSLCIWDVTDFVGLCGRIQIKQKAFQMNGAQYVEAQRFLGQDFGN